MPFAVGLVSLGREDLRCRPGISAQDFVPCVGQLVLANVPVKEWVIKPYEHGLLDGSDDGV